MDTRLDFFFWLMLLICSAALVDCLIACIWLFVLVVRDLRALIAEYRAGNGWNLPKTEGLCQKSN